ncbi:MAG: hypothetical protein WDN66_02530 [Candidatus Saccharibacteria bacterium]
MSGEFNEKDWFNRRRLTLDLVGLSDQERKEGSTMLGGSAAEFVRPGDDFQYSEVHNVAFEWGDEEAKRVFVQMIEHDDLPEEEAPLYLPWSATAVVGDTIWSTALQPKGFDPTQAYESEDHYFVLPYDKEEGLKALQEHTQLSIPRPELLGSIGPRWVAFEMGTELRPVGSLPHSIMDALDGEELDHDGVHDLLKNLVDRWDFVERDIRETNLFVTNLAHWVMETYGQENNKGEFFLYQGERQSSDRHDVWDGFDGEELPLNMQHLVMHGWKDELFLTNDNAIWMTSDHEHIENDPVLPEREYIESLPTFKQQLDYIRSHPEIIAGMKKGVVEVIPQVKLKFEPNRHGTADWGLEFLISQAGTRIYPYGQASHNREAVDYAREMFDRPVETVMTAAALVLLAAKYSEKHIRTVPVNQFEVLLRRLRGEETMPLCTANFVSKPSNSIVKLLIDTLLEDRDKED